LSFQALQVARGDLFDQVAREFDALGQQALVGLFVVQVGLEKSCRPADRPGASGRSSVRMADFVRKVPLELEDLRGFDGLVALVLFSRPCG